MLQFKGFLLIFCTVSCVCLLQIVKAGSDAEPVATYEEVKELPDHPEKYLFELRPRDMVEKMGAIPTSINIPLTELESALNLSDADFKAKFEREKPSRDAELIFTCLEGDWAKKGAELARSLGWKNAKAYMGSWRDWVAREGM